MVLENDETKNREEKKKIDRIYYENTLEHAKIIRGSIKSGQEVSFDTSVVILGNVKPRAKVRKYHYFRQPGRRGPGRHPGGQPLFHRGGGSDCIHCPDRHLQRSADTQREMVSPGAPQRKRSACHRGMAGQALHGTSQGRTSEKNINSIWRMQFHG